MKRHHEDNPYSLTDGFTTHSMPKRPATRTNPQSNSANNTNHSVDGNYSPPSSISSDSSSSTINSTCTSNPLHNQLCRCPNRDCVIHDNRHSSNLPVELTTHSNPTYGYNNLLLYYAHLERCRRHGQNIHQDRSS